MPQTQLSRRIHEHGAAVTFVPDADTPGVISACIPATIVERHPEAGNRWGRGKPHRDTYDITLNHNGQIVTDVPEQRLGYRI